MDLAKTKSVTRSNWAVRALTLHQIKYAALDVFSCGQVCCVEGYGCGCGCVFVQSGMLCVCVFFRAARYAVCICFCAARYAVCVCFRAARYAVWVGGCGCGCGYFRAARFAVCGCVFVQSGMLWVWVCADVFLCGQVFCVCFRAARYAVCVSVGGWVGVDGAVGVLSLCFASAGLQIRSNMQSPSSLCVCWSADQIKYAESIFVVCVLVCRSDQVCRVHLRCACAGLQIRSSMQSPSSLCVCWSADQIKFAESIFVVRVLICRSNLRNQPWMCLCAARFCRGWGGLVGIDVG